MARDLNHDGDAEELLNKLRPVLMEAIQGNFDSRIEMKEGDRFNEIYAGVQTLLDVICEQIKVLDDLGAQLSKQGVITYSSFSALPGVHKPKQK
jgi:hypothetical protein